MYIVIGVHYGIDIRYTVGMLEYSFSLQPQLFRVYHLNSIKRSVAESIVAICQPVATL